jgi:hypothetical protein
MVEDSTPERIAVSIKKYPKNNNNAGNILANLPCLGFTTLNGTAIKVMIKHAIGKAIRQCVSALYSTVSSLNKSGVGIALNFRFLCATF